MVGISARFIPHHSSSPEEIGEKASEEEGEEENVRTNNGVLKMNDFEMIIETEINFKPIEHPPEPPEDDHPIKCPIPDNLSLIVEAECEERSTESQSLQTIAELLEDKEKDKEESNIKNHEGDSAKEKEESNTKSHEGDFATSSQKCNIERDYASRTPNRSPHHKILHLFQQCKDLSA